MDGRPRVREDTAEVAFTRTVSFTRDVPQSLVLMERLTLTVQVVAEQACGVAEPKPGS